MKPCPSCGKDNPEGFSFCGFCGSALSAPAARSEERRVVTVLFCDLAGFTARSDRADPEDVRATLLPYHRCIKQEIERFGGTLDKFIGDGALGVFGSPTAHEDDPDRAVRAALAIQEEIRELNEAQPGLDLAARVGIATGEAVVAFGSGPQVGESVTGDIVNTASRIQSVAPVGGVLVGERTRAATLQTVEYEELQAVTVKGKAEPLPVWRAIRAAARGGPGPRPIHQTKFVGRLSERMALRDAIHSAGSERTVRSVLLVGPPGVGKSRLIAEARAESSRAGGGPSWRTGRCLPYGEGVAFWALEEIIRAQAGILESDPVDLRERKLTAFLAGLRVDRSELAWLRGRVAPLVGLDTGPAVDREESFAAWWRLLEGLASTTPLVVVIEDLHWAEDAMLAFVDGILERGAAVPLLLLLSSRPELLDRWTSRPSIARPPAVLTLSPLSREETAELASNLLDRHSAPETSDLLVRQSGGNPLYAEELARTLIDRSLLDEEGRPTASLEALRLPDTIHALIAARLDTLPGDLRAMVQDASVVGTSFWPEALASVGERDRDAVERGLQELARREFIRLEATSSVAGQPEYAFWHSMVRDAAYGQIPRGARAAKHGAVAGWIEAMPQERRADLADALVHHASTALDLTRATGAVESLPPLEDLARRALRHGGARAMRLDVERAGSLLERALALAPMGHPDRPAIRAGLGEAMFQGGRMDDAEAHLSDAVSGLMAQGRVHEAADAMVRLSVVVEYRGDPMRGRAILQDAIATLGSLAPGPALARALAESAGTLMVAGLYPEVLAAAERAAALAAEVGEAEAEARAHNFHGYARVALGDEGGLDELRRSVDAARALGLGRATAVSYSNLSTALMLVEGPGAALASMREAEAFAASRGLHESEVFIRNNTLTPLIELGAWDEALDLAARVVEETRTEGAAYEGTYAQVDLVHVRLWREGSAVADEAEALLERARPMSDLPLLLWAMGAAAMGRWARGDRDGAVALTREALDLTPGGAVVNRTDELTLWIRTAAGAGELELARGLMAGMESLRLPKYRAIVRSAGARVAEAEGRIEEAHRMHQEAAERWAALGVPLEHGLALLGAGRCAQRLGLTDDARRGLQDAGEIFERLGAGTVLPEARARLEGRPGPGTMAT